MKGFLHYAKAPVGMTKSSLARNESEFANRPKTDRRTKTPFYDAGPPLGVCRMSADIHLIWQADHQISQGEADGKKKEA